MLMKPPVIKPEDAVMSGYVQGYKDLEARLEVRYATKEIQALEIKVAGDRLDEFKLMLGKVLNCWDSAPAWMVEISDALNGVPQPARRPETA